MSYTPTTWVTGDKVTATKMNKLEQGVANNGGASGLLVTATVDGDTRTLDKTYTEIAAAFENGMIPVVKEVYDEGYGYGFIGGAGVNEDGAYVDTYTGVRYVEEDGVLTYQMLME